MNSEKLFIIICGLLNQLKQSWCIFKKQELRRKIVIFIVHNRKKK